MPFTQLIPESPCGHDEEYVRYLGVGYTTANDYYKCDECGYIFGVPVID
jgi:hypothetical protein